MDIPRDVLEHAEECGISIEDFRKSLEVFGTMQLSSEMSKLNRKSANVVSKKIKASAWKKVSRRLNL